MILQKWIETYLWLVQGSQSVKTSRTVSGRQTTAAVVGEATSRRNVSLHYLFLYLFFNFFSPVPRRFFELLFSSRFPWMWPWFITDLWLCVGGFPVTARNSTKIGMQAKSSLWMGLMSIYPARESCFFFLFWDLRFLLIKRSLLKTSLFMFCLAPCSDDFFFFSLLLRVIAEAATSVFKWALGKKC